MAKAKKSNSDPFGTDVRLAIRERGYEPIPVNGKSPIIKGWQEIEATPQLIKSTWPTKYEDHRNTGLLTKRTPAIDIDLYDAEGAKLVEALIRERFKGKGKLLRRVGQAPKCAFLFRTDQPFEKLQVPLIAPGEPEPQKKDKPKHKIEILGDGQQIVGYGIHPDTKKMYEWSGGEPWTVARRELPVLDFEEAKAVLAEIKDALLAAGWRYFRKPETETKANGHDGEGYYPQIVELGIKAWGPFTYHSGDEYRFGTHGSKSIDLRQRTWMDFESEVGGGVRDLAKLAFEESAAPRVPLRASAYKWIEPSQIQMREWLYKPHYIREFLSLIFSTGGIGKSSLAIAETMAMVSGRPLLRVLPSQKLRVWYWNGEDPLIELQRRFAAVAKHYGLAPEDIGDRLFIDSGRTLPIKIAIDDRSGTKVCEPVIKDVIETLKENRIDVLIIDPFVSCHAVNENDNSAIDLVAKSWSEIAEAARCSISAAHHVRKPSNDKGSTTDDGRGASALRDAARTVRAINTMTEKEAERAEIPDRERRSYFRANIGKANLFMPADQADWYQLVSVDLENGPEPNMPPNYGDKVGVVTPFDYPIADELKVTESDIVRVQEVLKNGDRWRLNSASTKEPWVGIPIASALGVGLNTDLDKSAIKALIKNWLESGILKRTHKMDAKSELREYVEAGNPPVVRRPKGEKRDGE